jgi:ribosomal protein S6E (S10)
MKAIVELLSRQDILCKKLTPITPKELGTRKRITLYIGVNIRGTIAV